MTDLRLRFFAFACAGGLAAACGGGNNPDPSIVAGGGVADPDIDGTVHVYVIDDTTDAPISGATVYVGTITGTTDATGLFTASADTLSGKQDISAIASGYTSSTWFGANGANVTIPLASTGTPTLTEATLTGTVAGWSGISIPGTGGVVAYVGFSATNTDGDPENDITQPNQTANTCQKTIIDPNAACDWSLRTRTGKQVVYAFIAAGDQNGADITGFAYKTGIDVQDGVDQSNISLALAGSGDLEVADVTLPSEPAGTDTVNAAARIDTGDDGRVQLPLSGIPQIGSYTVPKASLFPGSTIDLVGIATSSNDPEAQSLQLVRGLDSVNSGGLATFMPLPTGLSTDGSMFTYGAVSGAAITMLKVHDASGTNAWAAVALDGSTTVTRPAAITLPSGSLTFDAAALAMPSFDPQDFSVDDIADQITATSQAGVTFTN